MTRLPSLTMSVAEVAAALGMSESGVYERVRRGDIKNVGVGGRVRIPRLWLERRFADAGAPLSAPVTTVDEGTFS